MKKTVITRRACLRAMIAGAATMGFARGMDSQPARARNVIFLIVDDLRPLLGCYGYAHMRTPNLDALAAKGTRLGASYCQIPVCGASRASLLTGVRPKPDTMLDYDTWKDRELPNVASLPMHLKNQGFTTVTNSKVYHHSGDDAGAWTGVSDWRPRGTWSGISYFNPDNRRAAEASKQGGRASYFERGPDDERLYPDALTADKTIEDLRQLAESKTPFFLASGFIRPHLPFAVPERYWKMYDPQTLPFPPVNPPPGGVPEEQAMKGVSGELRAYLEIPPEGPFDEATARNIIHGYHASVSFIDTQVGRVLDEIERLGLQENTLVVVTADHGWNLAEHGLFCKHTLFEPSLRVPTIFSGPGIPAGAEIREVTEHVDLYPTICEALGIRPPGHVEGSSLWTALTRGTPPEKQHAISRWKDGWSVKTATHRYSRWKDADGKLVAEMLYDHSADPGETVNVVSDPRQESHRVKLALVLDAEAARWK